MTVHRPAMLAPTMSTKEKILTKHPQGKLGVSISRHKYDAVREQFTVLLADGAELTYSELAAAAGTALDGRFDGSIRWYTEVVKLDLEARGVIERLTDVRPQRYRLVTR